MNTPVLSCEQGGHHQCACRKVPLFIAAESSIAGWDQRWCGELHSHYPVHRALQELTTHAGPDQELLAPLLQGPTCTHTHKHVHAHHMQLCLRELLDTDGVTF